MPQRLASELGTAESAPDRQQLLRRAGDRATYLLAHDDADQACLYVLQSEGLFALARDEASRHLETLRQTDLEDIVLAAGELCLYRARDEIHYEAPSGVHCAAFLRLGDAIQSLEALERMAFWLRPLLSSSSAVLIDTWSISSVVLRALQTAGKEVPFDCLTGHPIQSGAIARDVIARLVRGQGEKPTLTCIVSVTSSGRYNTALNEICESLGVIPEIKGIYGLSTGDRTNVLCRLDQISPRNYPADDCGLCREDSVPISVHPGLYYAKDVREIEVMLPPDKYAVCTEVEKDALGVDETFLRRYRHVPAVLGVHRTNDHDEHEAFFVDVDKLLDDQVFKTRLDSRLERIEPRPGLIISSASAEDKKLGEHAAQFFGAKHVRSHSIRRDRAPALEGDLAAAQNVLVVQASVSSPSSLDAYNRAFREERPHVTSVGYLIAFARPPADRDLAAWQRMLVSQHQGRQGSISVVEFCPLPRWGADDCPWCHEYKFLSETAATLSEPPGWLTARIGDLAQLKQGMRDAPLWWLPGMEPPVLGDASLLAPAGAQSMEVVFALATALQRLRGDEKGLRPKPPQMRVISANVLNRYTEALLRAALFRVVAPAEWGAISRAPATKLAAACALQEGQELILGELLLAISRRSFRRELPPALETQYRTRIPGVFEKALETLRLL